MCGLVGTIALIPLTIIIYVARIAMHENDGPIFYDQLRIGKNGKVFKMYKYRSMVIGADEKLHKYLEENEEARKEYKKSPYQTLCLYELCKSVMLEKPR